MVKNVHIPDDAPDTFTNLAAKNGAPDILIEYIDDRWISRPSTKVGVGGVLNITKTFDMIDGDMQPLEGRTDKFLVKLSANQHI